MLKGLTGERNKTNIEPTLEDIGPSKVVYLRPLLDIASSLAIDNHRGVLINK